jgi:hypothetical protein
MDEPDDDLMREFWENRHIPDPRATLLYRVARQARRVYWWAASRFHWWAR